MAIVSIPFKPQKHFYDRYSIFMPSFNSFLPGVCPVDVTLHILISVNPHRIPTKAVTKIYFNEPCSCTKFQSIHTHFTAKHIN